MIIHRLLTAHAESIRCVKVVLYPKNRIFCALGRFFENAINGHFNHSLTLFRGVFGGNMSYEDRICQKLVVCPIFCLRNALSNGCLHSLFQNFEGLWRFFKAIYSGIVTWRIYGLVAITAALIIASLVKNFTILLSIEKRAVFAFFQVKFSFLL